MASCGTRSELSGVLGQLVHDHGAGPAERGGVAQGGRWCSAPAARRLSCGALWVGRPAEHARLDFHEVAGADERGDVGWAVTRPPRRAKPGRRARRSAWLVLPGPRRSRSSHRRGRTGRTGRRSPFQDRPGRVGEGCGITPTTSLPMRERRTLPNPPQTIITRPPQQPGTDRGTSSSRYSSPSRSRAAPSPRRTPSPSRRPLRSRGTTPARHRTAPWPSPTPSWK